VVKHPRFAVAISILSGVVPKISGFGGMISGCPPATHLFGETSSELANVFYCKSYNNILKASRPHYRQHVHKIFQFQNYSPMFDVTSNNFRCADRRSDCCILCLVHVQEKSENGLPQLLTKIVNDAKTELGAF